MCSRSHGIRLQKEVVKDSDESDDSSADEDDKPSKGKRAQVASRKKSVGSKTKAKKAEDKERRYLHRGIAARNFERRFQLADHVEVRGADLQDGLLHVELVRNVPERLKPRTVAIGKAGPKQVEAAAAA